MKRNIDYGNLHLQGDYNRAMIRLKEEELDYLERIAICLEKLTGEKNE